MNSLRKINGKRAGGDSNARRLNQRTWIRLGSRIFEWTNRIWHDSREVQILPGEWEYKEQRTLMRKVRHEKARWVFY